MKKMFQKLIVSMAALYMALWFVPTTEITGRIALVGTSLFYEVVIITEDEDMIYFDESLNEEFLPFQNQTITINAKIKDKKISLADGSKTFLIPTIYSAKIIK